MIQSHGRYAMCPDDWPQVLLYLDIGRYRNGVAYCRQALLQQSSYPAYGKIVASAERESNPRSMDAPQLPYHLATRPW